MSDDHLRDKIVQYFIVGLLAAVVIFLIFGLARGDGGESDEPAATPTAAPSLIPKQTVMEAQVGCQQPAGTSTAKGKTTLPPNPGVTARKSSAKRAVVSVTIPTSTQECRVGKVRVEVDSTADELPATSKTVDVMTGPPIRQIKVKLAAGSGPPQLARAFAVTPDGRSSSGATVAVR